MNNIFYRQIAFVSGLLLLFSFIGHAQRGIEYISEEVAASFQKKQVQIKSELELSQLNEWSGYYIGHDDQLTASLLSWSATSGFAIWREKCDPSDTRVNYGTLDFNGKSLIFLPERIEKSQNTYTFSSWVFVPVKWGEQHWLIPSDKLILFAYAVNSGSNTEIDRFFVKVSDSMKERKGSPLLPKEYSSYLRVKSKRTQVLEVGGSEPNWYPKLTINVGSSHGVVEGMNFWLFGAKNVDVQIQVTEVGKQKSVARVTDVMITGEKDIEIKPKVGWRFSSRASKNY